MRFQRREKSNSHPTLWMAGWVCANRGAAVILGISASLTMALCWLTNSSLNKGQKHMVKIWLTRQFLFYLSFYFKFSKYICWIKSAAWVSLVVGRLPPQKWKQRLKKMKEDISSDQKHGLENGILGSFSWQCSLH